MDMPVSRWNRLEPRRWLAAAMVVAAGAASLATSEAECPLSASLSADEPIDSASPSVTKRYRIVARNWLKLHVRAEVTSGTSVLLRLVPEDPTLFETLDGSTTLELPLGGSADTQGELGLRSDPGACSGSRCDEIEVQVTAEQTGGTSGAVSWEIIAESEGCDAPNSVIRIDEL